MEDDRSGQVLAVAVLFFVLSWVAVSLRVYVRAVMIKSFGLDDTMMVVTLLSFTGYLVCQIAGVMHGTGKHLWDIPDADARIALRYWWLCEIFYIIASCTIKFAISLFLLRVAVKKVHIWILRGVIVCTALFGVCYLFICIFQCKPVSNFWMLPPQAEGCLPSYVITRATYVATCLAAVADWTCGLLPIFLIWDLQMDNRTKILIGSILSFAAIGSTATIVRIPFVGGLMQTDDFLWATTDIAIWSTVEPGVGIVAGCVATLRPLWQLIAYKTGMSSTNPLGSKRSTPMARSGGAFGKSGLNLDSLRPDGAAGTVTTITGRNGSGRRKDWALSSWKERSRGSEEEIITQDQSGLPQNIISKSVEVTYSENDAESDEGGRMGVRQNI